MSTTLARKYRTDLTTDLTLAGGWVQLKAVDDWNDSVTPNVEETTNYDTVGWKSKEITLQDWSAVASGFRQIISAVYDPGQEMLRACRGQFGDAGRIGVRWYDRNGGPEAYKGVAIVTWNRANTGVANVEKWTANLDGDATYGALTVITNPATPLLVPVLVGATPSGQAVGASVVITGSGFTGTVSSTGVKFGGTAATSFSVINDSLITAVLPTGTAGTTSVTVTNAVGTSPSFTYTRAA